MSAHNGDAPVGPASPAPPDPLTLPEGIILMAEFPRDPDGWVGPLTTGQALSVPMILIGLYLAFRAKPAKG